MKALLVSLFSICFVSVLPIIAPASVNDYKSFISGIPQIDLKKNVQLYPAFKNGLWGYINTTGELVIRPQFNDAYPFYDSLAVVCTNGLYGYIDTKGNFLLPPAYDFAEPFYNGVARVYIDAKPLFINKDGQTAFTHSFMEIEGFKGQTFTIATTYTGKKCLLNNRGIMITDTVFKSIEACDKGIFCVVGLNDKSNDYEKGNNEVISQKGAINYKGEWLIKFGECDQLLYSKEGVFDCMSHVKKEIWIDVFLNKTYKKDPKPDKSVYYTYVDQDSDTTILSSLTDSLVLVEVKEKLGYMNTKREIVWQQEPFTGTKVNVTYMIRGYFNSRSPDLDDSEPNINAHYFDPLPSTTVHSNKLVVTIDTMDKDVKYYEEFEGYKVFVSNFSADTAYFEAQDGRIYMNMQAKAKNGEWKDIEYLPNSWCGNSYHTLWLPPQKAWSFVMPQYSGVFKTQLRAKLTYHAKYPHDTKYIDRNKFDITIYSNEIEGSVNPSQFWRKSGYTPSGIMDPYNE